MKFDKIFLHNFQNTCLQLFKWGKNTMFRYHNIMQSVVLESSFKPSNDFGLGWFRVVQSRSYFCRNAVMQ